ncbi:unnamed protein product [Effrenium voratum]|nr:unnamed protein product [Effrenium voratum]
MGDQLNLNAASSFKSPPKYSFTHSPVLSKDKASKQPGPGEYPLVKSEKDKFGKTPSWSIGAAGRSDGKAWAAMPGPGAYTPADPSLVSPKWGFTNDNRLKPNKRSTTPGPGQYELKTTLQGKDVSICSKPEGKSLTALPGPGAFTPSYASTSNYGSAPAVGFGAANRGKMVSSKTPGPGQYEIPTTLIGNVTMKSPSAYSIKGKWPHMGSSKSATTPGPAPAGTTFK